jgi:hypothetical protein
MSATLPEADPRAARAGRDSRPSVAAVCVGLFALWQLAYLPLANLIDFVPRRAIEPQPEVFGDPCQDRGTFTRVEPLQRAAERAGDVLDCWAELSGQEQGWGMFTPGPPPYSCFVAVEFRFADGTRDTLLSRYEPDHLRPGFRTPLIHDRAFNFEMRFTFDAWYLPNDQIAEHPDLYARLPAAARALRAPIVAFLKLRLRDYRARHPGRGAPTDAILKHRFIRTPRPGEPTVWGTTIDERPYAKWTPATDTYEVFDAVRATFVPEGAK